MVDFTGEEISALADTLAIALDDQENYRKSGDMSMDYESDDLRGKAKLFRDTASAVQKLGQTGLADRLETLAAEIEQDAVTMDEGEDILCECGREEKLCAVFDGAEDHRDRT